MCCISNETAHLLFNYYISKLGEEGGDLADTGEGGVFQDLGKPADVILERSLSLLSITRC